jgi:predicted transcriptional regulator
MPLHRALTRTVGTLVPMCSATAGAPVGPTATGSAAPVGSTPSSIDVTTEGRTVVLAVVRCLDEATGDALLDAATAALDSAPDRIDVDLRALESFTAAGAQALVGCRDLSVKLPEGLHYRTGRGAGREALMAAYDGTNVTFLDR